MNKKTSKLLLLGFISIMIISCAALPSTLIPTGASQPDKLPKGMVSGVWGLTSDGTSNKWIFFDDGYYYHNLGRFYQYTLVNKNEILITGGNEADLLLTIEVEEPNKKITMATEGGYITVDLIFPNTSSGDLKKDIIGTWNANWHGSCSELLSGEVTESNWIIESDGTGIFTIREFGTPFTYKFVGDKAFIRVEDDEASLIIHSLGDLLILDIDGDSVCLIRQ